MSLSNTIPYKYLVSSEAHAVRLMFKAKGKALYARLNVVDIHLHGLFCSIQNKTFP
ncbi:protein of unknown function [Shewanella benthica]|uniref:Uncharacterized protein n=1 Tax=Shewanella benthica TaxID=43661 RepID=A0A330M200_9GAMM|nr:protein of unknown function [Shewanella benthica]